MSAATFRPVEGAEPIPGYRLEALLGRGGFGEVWRTQAPGGFPVALKFLAIDAAGSERELRSLQMLQRVRDGHLLGLFGVWQLPGFFVLAMELADGTLMDRLHECRRQNLPGIPRDELLDYFQQAARGIDFLNEARHVLVEGGQPAAIQHGDIKPQNLLLVGTLCKVGDFGLLLRLAATASQKTGSMTVAYAPPEVIDRKPSPRSDQYALAVSWCQLRAGRLPFEGEPVQLMAGHLYRPPDLSMLPQGERPAVGRALAKKPEERWPSCRAFVDALRSAAPEPRPAPRIEEEPSLATIPSSSTPTVPPPKGGPQVRALYWVSILLLLFAIPVVSLLVATSGPSGGEKAKGGPAGDEAKTKRDDVKPRPFPEKGQAGVNSIGMKFVWIKPGNFLMGSPDGKAPPGVPAEAERSDDETPHRVTLTRGFHMAACLVTQEQWELVLGKAANHSRFLGKDEDEKKKLPVDNVSWFDCVEFCNKLSEREGRKPCYRLTNVQREGDKIKSADVEVLADGTGYRLPSEAQWEYACRAETTTPCWCGETITTDQANYDGNYPYRKDDKKGEYRQKTTPVEQFQANPWGLHDMHGNLWQWCGDWFGAYLKEEIRDPQGSNNGDARVLRGGSWVGHAFRCRAACRRRNAPAYRYELFGCRVVLCRD
jgi:formylglycine-generating enzyme required for sulfatase activity/serine/threonine protein kinase